MKPTYDHRNPYCRGVSRRQLEALGEPLGESATRIEGGRMVLGSGGGGGTSNPDSRYANLDRLYGIQSQASQYMLDNAMQYVPTVMGNSATMVDDAMDGTLAKQLREQAGNDATATMGTALDANLRNMQRAGMQFDSNRLLSEGNKAAIMGAATKAGAMSKADATAEDIKWNRNANFYGQVTGMNSGAMQGMSNATSGLTSIANQQSANSAANASGYGQAGAAFAGSLFKADGGQVRGRTIEGKAVRLASGGNAWETYKLQNPVQVSSGSGGRNNGGAGVFLAGAAPYALGFGLKDIINADGKGGKIVKGIKKAVDYVQDAQAANETAQQSNDYAQAADRINTAMAGQEAGAGLADVSALGAAYDTAGNIVAASDAASSAADAATAADAASTASSASDAAWMADSAWFANGGGVKKHGLKMALGGLANALAVDNIGMADHGISDSSRMPSVAGMDVSGSMKVSSAPAMVKMPSVAKSSGAVQQQAPGGPSVSDATRGYSAGDKAATAGAANAEAAEKAKAAADASAAADAAAQSGDAASTISTAKDAAEAANAADSAATAAEGASAGSVPYGSVVKAGADILSGRDAGTAVADAAASYAGAEAGAAAGTAVMPGVGTVVGGVLGGLLGGSLFAEGGDVTAGSGLADIKRKDFTPGGAVHGAGTETSDDIPAWLSDGEHVQNAVSTELAGSKTLDRINQAGLAVRHGKATKQEAKQTIGLEMVRRGKELLGGKDGVQLAGGGFLGGNLGIAMGAGVQQMNQQRQLDRLDQMAQIQNDQNQRAQESHAAQLQERQAKQAREKAAADVWREAAPALVGNFEDRAKYLEGLYNANNEAAGYGDGMKAEVRVSKDGAKAVFRKPDGSVAEERDFTAADVHNEMIGSVYRQLSAVDPAYGERFVKHISKPYDDKARAEALKAEIDIRNKANIELEKVRGENRIAVEKVRSDGDLSEIRARSAAGGYGSSRAGGGGGDASKGAKFDMDAEGNRVIIYRNGQMVYPKDADGNPVKIRVGTDEDQKFTRKLVNTWASKDITPPSDPVAKAQELTQRTGGKQSSPSLPSGLPEGSKQIGTSGGKPVYQAPNGKKFIAE